MKSVIIACDQNVSAHTKVLEQLIKLIACPSEIKHIGYHSEIKHIGYHLDEHDDKITLEGEGNDREIFLKEETLFVICPYSAINNSRFVSTKAIASNQVIPVTYRDSTQDNFPPLLKGIADLPLSGCTYPHLAVSRLCKILNVSDPLDTLSKLHLKQDDIIIKAALSDLIDSAIRIVGVDSLLYMQRLQKLILKTAEKLKSALASRPESEQRQMANFFKGTPIGNCLEKIGLEKDQEIVTNSFRR